MRTIRGFSNSAPLMLYAKEILHVIFDNDLHPSSAIFPRFFFFFANMSSSDSGMTASPKAYVYRFRSGDFSTQSGKITAR